MRKNSQTIRLLAPSEPPGDQTFAAGKFPYKKKQTNKQKKTFPRFLKVYVTRDNFTCSNIWSPACQRWEVQNTLQTQKLAICKSSVACSIGHSLNFVQATNGYMTSSNVWGAFLRRQLNAAVRQVYERSGGKLYFLQLYRIRGVSWISVFFFFFWSLCYLILRGSERLYLRAGVGRAGGRGWGDGTGRDVETARTVNISSSLCMVGARHGLRGLWRAPGFITARIATIRNGILLSLSRYHRSPLNNSPASEC